MPAQYLESVRVTAYSVVEDWFMGVEVFTHTYPTPSNGGNPWEVHFTGCCQLDNVLNVVNSGSPTWDVMTTINLLDADRSPRIVSLPVIYFQSGQPTTFSLATAGASAAVGSLTPTAAVTWALGTSSGGVTPTGVTVGTDGTCVVTITCPAGTASYCLYGLQAYAAAGSAKVPVSLLLNLSVASVPTFDPSTVPATNWQFSLFAGFEGKLDIRGYLPSGAGSKSVGFSAGTMPSGARLSTVRGKGTSSTAPAIVTFRWTPSTPQLGTDVACFDVVDSTGIACTQKCLGLSVVLDTPPTLSLSLDGRALALQTVSSIKCPLGPCLYALLYIGTDHELDVTAVDQNAGDTLTLEAVPPPSDVAAAAAALVAASPSNVTCGQGVACLPPGATWTDPVTTTTASSVSVARSMLFTPAYNHGGYLQPVCFRVSDSCGLARAGDPCPGRLDAVTQCVWIQVQRCRFIVRAGHQLQTIAAVYKTDWLQLWSLNQWLLSPDSGLAPGQVLNIGHDYAVQPLDTPAAVSSRFGMDAASFAALNADLADDAAQARYLCTSTAECAERRWCVMPSSCKGASGSVYSSAQASYSDSTWFPSMLSSGASSSP
mmetsp:Transcript_68570/g.182976  ORF Transcript_68570/g.182976 Transcript_68570/m.182976 type:complete len:599 (-) Transcript_68570:27-1823(-)